LARPCLLTQTHARTTGGIGHAVDRAYADRALPRATPPTATPPTRRRRPAPLAGRLVGPPRQEGDRERKGKRASRPPRRIFSWSPVGSCRTVSMWVSMSSVPGCIVSLRSFSAASCPLTLRMLYMVVFYPALRHHHPYG